MEKKRGLALQQYRIFSLKKSYTFKPDLSLTQVIGEKFLQRKGTYQRISDSRKGIVEYLRRKAMNTDLETGQELFKPKITRSFWKNSGSILSCENKIKRAVHKRSNSCKLTSRNSEKILERIKNLRFKKIFVKLGPENEKISLGTISKSVISRRLRQILRPLIEKLEIKAISLDFLQFSVEMEELLKRLTPESRNYIIRGEIGEIQQTFSTSPTLVKGESESSNGPTIYERGLQRLARTQKVMESLRKHREESEINTCSFSPVIKRYSPPKPYVELWSLGSTHRVNRSSID